jgi:hypothetical protein
MPKEQEITQSNRRGREADHTLAKGFRPLGLPAVAAAAKAMARRPKSTPSTTARKQPDGRDDG